jgi:hypothetical protein
MRKIIIFGVNTRYIKSLPLCTLFSGLWWCDDVGRLEDIAAIQAPFLSLYFFYCIRSSGVVMAEDRAADGPAHVPPPLPNGGSQPARKRRSDGDAPTFVKHPKIGNEGYGLSQFRDRDFPANGAMDLRTHTGMGPGWHFVKDRVDQLVVVAAAPAAETSLPPPLLRSASRSGRRRRRRPGRRPGRRSWLMSWPARRSSVRRQPLPTAAAVAAPTAAA